MKPSFLLLFLCFLRRSSACSKKEIDKFAHAALAKNMGDLLRGIPNKNQVSAAPENLPFFAGDIISCKISAIADHVLLASSTHTVIHAEGTPNGETTGRTKIVEETFERAAIGRYTSCAVITEWYDWNVKHGCHAGPSLTIYTSEKAIDRARDSIEEFRTKTVQYNVVHCNCEHWVTSWKYGLAISLQLAEDRNGFT